MNARERAVRNAKLKARIAEATRLANAITCDCWEGCNDREGKLPCPHDILWEGVKLWAEKYPTAKEAEYK